MNAARGRLREDMKTALTVLARLVLALVSAPVPVPVPVPVAITARSERKRR